jgi:hypothetical protein
MIDRMPVSLRVRNFTSYFVGNNFEAAMLLITLGDLARLFVSPVSQDYILLPCLFI